MLLPPSALSLPIDLGSAGPGPWTVLQIGPGQITSLNSGGGVTGITGNVGMNQNSQLKLAGSASINGDVFLGTGASASRSGSSTIHGNIGANPPMLIQASNDAVTASKAAAALSSSGGGAGVSSISSGGNLTPGVYNITSLNLNNRSLRLAGGGSYVFNISGALALRGSSSILLDAGLSEADVLFNITGTKDVVISGGGRRAVLHGIILALKSRVNLNPGLVVGEIISGNSINLASGATVQAVNIPRASVPDEGATLVYLGLSLLGLAMLTHARQLQVARHTPVTILLTSKARMPRMMECIVGWTARPWTRKATQL